MIIHCDSVRYIWEVFEGQEYQFLFNKLVVVDLGCNIGTFSLWIYKLADRIYAVDPDEVCLDKFRKTIKDNELIGIKLYKERLLDLGEFLKGHDIPKVDVLKIDIEGDEIQVIENNFPKDKVRVIIGEYHNFPVKDQLERLGYRYTEYPNRHFLARL